jgi:hypothetical protein
MGGVYDVLLACDSRRERVTMCAASLRTRFGIAVQGDATTFITTRRCDAWARTERNRRARGWRPMVSGGGIIDCSER